MFFPKEEKIFNEIIFLLNKACEDCGNFDKILMQKILKELFKITIKNRGFLYEYVLFRLEIKDKA